MQTFIPDVSPATHALRCYQAKRSYKEVLRDLALLRIEMERQNKLARKLASVT